MASVINPSLVIETITPCRLVLNIRPGRVVFIGWIAAMLAPITVLSEILAKGF